MATVVIDKVVAAVPVSLAPNRIYAVRVGTGVSLYLSNSDGTAVHPINSIVPADGAEGDVLEKTGTGDFDFAWTAHVKVIPITQTAYTALPTKEAALYVITGP